MNWSDVVMTMFACVMAIHLGLVDAVLGMFRMKDLPIVNCPKCLTWWSSMAVCLMSGLDLITSVATSFLLAYLAIWYDLLLGCLDTLYGKIYTKLYQDTAEDTDVHDTAEHHANKCADVVPEVRLSEEDFE